MLKKRHQSKHKYLEFKKYHSISTIDVELFVEQMYKKIYNATIYSHYSNFIGITNNNKIVSVLGFRYAKNKRLFLEQYLTQPIELLLSNKLKISTINREHIIEIGSFVSQDSFATLLMLEQLIIYLKKQNIHYVCVTVTKHLERYFKIMGIKGIRMSAAKYNNLHTNINDWGNYYEHKPNVFFVKTKDLYVIKKSPLLISNKSLYEYGNFLLKTE